MVLAGPLVPRLIAAGGEEGWRLAWYFFAGVTVLLTVLNLIVMRDRPGLPSGDESALWTPNGRSPLLPRDDRVRDVVGDTALRLRVAPGHDLLPVRYRLPNLLHLLPKASYDRPRLQRRDRRQPLFGARGGGLVGGFSGAPSPIASAAAVPSPSPCRSGARPPCSSPGHRTSRRSASRPSSWVRPASSSPAWWARPAATGSGPSSRPRRSVSSPSSWGRRRAWDPTWAVSWATPSARSVRRTCCRPEYIWWERWGPSFSRRREGARCRFGSAPRHQRDPRRLAYAQRDVPQVDVCGRGVQSPANDLRSCRLNFSSRS